MKQAILNEADYYGIMLPNQPTHASKVRGYVILGSSMRWNHGLDPETLSTDMITPLEFFVRNVKMAHGLFVSSKYAENEIVIFSDICTGYIVRGGTSKVQFRYRVRSKGLCKVAIRFSGRFFFFFHVLLIFDTFRFLKLCLLSTFMLTKTYSSSDFAVKHDRLMVME